MATDYRADVYQAVAAYAKTEPKLAGEEARLLADTVRDYRRAGLALSDADRKEVETMRKELASLATDFGTNVTKATAHVTFTRAELAGVPEDFLNSSKVKTGDDDYTVAADETYQYELVDGQRAERNHPAQGVRRARQPGEGHERADLQPDALACATASRSSSVTSRGPISRPRSRWPRPARRRRRFIDESDHADATQVRRGEWPKCGS